MKIIATSDWHLGNLFHGNDRLPEHEHFFRWLTQTIRKQQPDALLVAGDVFDNGNPSAAAQTAYYRFLDEATQCCPDMRIIITAGNHDSANRLEAPRPLLTRHHVEIRGNVHRTWNADTKGWSIDYDDLMIPVKDSAGNELIVLAVPFLRSDMVQGESFSQGVNHFLRELTDRARQRHPGKPVLMMAHLYASGANIANKDASEKIVIGGQEQVAFEQWDNHPDYLTCGHIHNQQQIWGTRWARYTGSVLPMSFVEKNYTHGVDLLTFRNDNTVDVQQLVYEPQHKLKELPDNEDGLEVKELKKLIQSELREPNEGESKEHADYVKLNVRMEKVDNDAVKQLEDLVNSKDAICCKINRVHTLSSVVTLSGNTALASIDDILRRDPMETLKEAFAVKHKSEMSDEQIALLDALLKEDMNETQA